MNTATRMHPLMLAAAIAFWGWQTGLWVVAVPVALLLCASFYASLRWTLSDAQQYRVADFCTVLALLLGAYLYFTYGNPRAIVLFFQWLPVMFLPLALTHAYSSSEHMDLRVLFWSLRRNPPSRPVTFAPWFPYYSVWIIAASAANVRSVWFYAGLVMLVSWPLVRIRPWSYRVGTWGVAFSIAVALGYGLQWGLHNLQGWLENAVPEWISAAGARTDPYRSTTDIGHIGKLKDSDAIVLRVTVPDGTAPPHLLHRASYNTYFRSEWIARGMSFTRVEAGPNNRWPLAQATGTARVTVHDYSAQPNPVLSLPSDTTAIENLSAISVQRNALGAVQIVRDPGYFSYTAAYAKTSVSDTASTTEDLRLPVAERNAFETLANTLELKTLPPDAIVARVRQFFASHYHYATFQKDAAVAASPVVDFLLRTKSGHCEYFATATVLLLRAASIPARYATGFAVVDKNDFENAYVVRQRHAHAWARAQVNGLWIDIDTTPPTWIAAEAEHAGAWSALGDKWSWLRFRAARAWANRDEHLWLAGAMVLVFPFALWLAWRLYRSRRVSKNNELNQIFTSSPPPPGADSEFYRITQQLQARGWARRDDETTHDWLARLHGHAPLDITALMPIAALHNRYRFDPRGLDAAQRQQLRTAAEAWLRRLPPQPANS